MIPALALGLAGACAGLAIDAIATRLAAPSGAGEVGSTGAVAARSAVLRATALRAGDAPAGPTAKAIGHALLLASVTAGVFAMAAARYDDPGQLAIVLGYLTVLLVCAAVDIRTFRVPNVVTYPAIAGALTVAVVSRDASVALALGGGAVTGGLLLAPALLTRGAGLGMGDVKLATFAGLALGIQHVVPMLLLMGLSGGAVAAFLLATGLRGRRDPIPYAPFVSGATIVVLLVHGCAFAAL